MLKQTKLAVAQSNEIYRHQHLYASYTDKALKPFIILLVNFYNIVNKNIIIMKSIFNIRSFRYLSLIFSVALLTTIFSSCKKNDDNNNALVAGVAVTNASSIPQDVYFDNEKINATAMAYTETAGYFRVTGSPTVTFKTAGTASVNGSAATSFMPGKYYNVFYADDKSVTVYENDPTPPSSGKARIRFINLSTGVGSSADFGISGGAKIVSGLTYKAASAYQEVNAANSYSLYTGGSTTVLLNLPVTLSAGGIYTLYISGSTSPTVGFKLIGEN
jgi:hypothetical protein